MHRCDLYAGAHYGRGRLTPMPTFSSVVSALAQRVLIGRVVYRGGSKPGAIASTPAPGELSRRVAGKTATTGIRSRLTRIALDIAPHGITSRLLSSRYGNLLKDGTPIQGKGKEAGYHIRWSGSDYQGGVIRDEDFHVDAKTFDRNKDNMPEFINQRWQSVQSPPVDPSTIDWIVVRRIE